MSVFRELTDSQRKCLEFLRRELADGAVAVAELHCRAREARVPINSLSAARKILNVRVFRKSQGGNNFWELPQSENKSYER